MHSPAYLTDAEVADLDIKRLKGYIRTLRLYPLAMLGTVEAEFHRYKLARARWELSRLLLGTV